MEDQIFTFDVDETVLDRAELMERIEEIFPQANAERMSAAIAQIVTAVQGELRSGLSWDADLGTLSGTVSMEIPGDIDLEEPMTEESTGQNLRAQISDEFDELVDQAVESLRSGA